MNEVRDQSQLELQGAKDLAKQIEDEIGPGNDVVIKVLIQFPELAKRFIYTQKRMREQDETKQLLGIKMFRHSFQSGGWSKEHNSISRSADMEPYHPAAIISVQRFVERFRQALNKEKSGDAVKEFQNYYGYFSSTIEQLLVELMEPSKDQQQNGSDPVLVSRIRELSNATLKVMGVTAEEREKMLQYLSVLSEENLLSNQENKFLKELTSYKDAISLLEASSSKKFPSPVETLRVKMNALESDHQEIIAKLEKAKRIIADFFS